MLDSASRCKFTDLCRRMVITVKSLLGMLEISFILLSFQNVQLLLLLFARKTNMACVRIILKRIDFLSRCSLEGYFP